MNYWLLPVLLAGLVVLKLLSNALKPGLISLPGPLLAKFSNLWRVYQVHYRRYPFTIAELHRKHGSLVRLGPNVVSISDVRVVDDIYGTRSDFPKGDGVKSSQGLFKGKVVPALLSTVDKKVHAALKRPVASTYSMTSVLAYEPYVNETIRSFLSQLDKLFISTGQKCDIDNWVQYIAYDTVGQMTMSRSFGFLDKGQDVDGMLHDLDVEFTYRGTVAVMPSIDDLVRRNSFINYFRPPKTSAFMARARRILDDRLNDADHHDPSRRDFVARFLDTKKANPESMPDRNMVSYVATNLLAGSDTTALILRTALYYVMKNPGVLRTLRKELEASNVTYPVSFATAFKELPYTDAIIKESLRIVPAGSGIMERVVPPQGFEMPDGRKLPGGTTVGMSPLVVMHDKGVFGADADKFNPDRWLQGSHETDEAYHERLRAMKAADLSFGRGNRGCLGRHVAELEIYKIVPTIFGLIDMQLVEPEKEWTIKPMFFMRQYDMDVKMQWRSGKSLDDLQL